MKYYFILGNNPALSIAEICAVFPRANEMAMAGDAALMIETGEFNAKDMIRRLGGTIKIGMVDGILEMGDYKEMAAICTGLAKLGKDEGKLKFGISYYGKGKFNTKPLGMEIKNAFKETGRSVRWVISREPVLSSVVVEQNKLVGGGVEFVLLPTEKKEELIVGRTLAVQPFKELSKRDYGRPGRDDYSGMLPPKLAQIMINLAAGGNTPLIRGERGVLLDPFCGSGTVLTEAVLMGYKNVIGSDISEKAVKDSEINLEWTMKNYELRITNYELFKLSATELSRKIQANSIDAIATEPYLGPQRGDVNIRQVVKDLEILYSEAMREFAKVLKPGGRVVMALPVFTKINARVNPNLGKMKVVNPLPELFRKEKNIKLTNRNTIIYGRQGQKVWREIVILEK